MKKPILLVAYQCGHGMGSVSQIGWEWYVRLSLDYEVTLVTHVRNRAAIEANRHLVSDGAEIIYIDTEWFAGPLYRIAKRIFPRSEHSVFLVSSLDYFVFDFAAFRHLKAMICQGKHWTLLHRVTPVTLAAPTWLSRLGLPTMIGPLNSGLSDPHGFSEIMKQESSWLIRSRKISELYDRLISSTRNVARILTASRATLEAVTLLQREKCRPMIENGVDLRRFSSSPWPEAPSTRHPLRVLFVGRLIPLKALNLLLQAVARLANSGRLLELDVVGDGPMRAEWEALAGTLGISNIVRFLGNQPIDSIPIYMEACHVFCLPSVRESGGAVLLEAMAVGRPVIAINHGGPGEIVDDEVGRLIAAHSPIQVEADLQSCIDDVITNPQAWQRRAESGPERVKRLYSWEAKVRSVSQHYDEIILSKGVSA